MGVQSDNGRNESPGRRWKRVSIGRPWGEDGPRLISVSTERLHAYFHGTQPVAVITHFEPSADFTALSNIDKLLTEELGQDWFEEVMPPPPPVDEIVSAVVRLGAPDRTRFLTILAGWWSLANMRTRLPLGQFLELAMGGEERAENLWGELTARLQRLAVDALDEWPEATLSKEAQALIEKLVSTIPASAIKKESK